MKKRYFKDAIKAYRLDKHYTQRQFAELLGLQYQTIQNYEYGRFEPSLSFLLKLKQVDPALDYNTLLAIDEAKPTNK